MAIKTMSASTGGSSFEEGWHEVTKSKAEYGIYETVTGDSKNFLDVWFEGYPDSMNLRVYEVFNKTTKEEFNIANIFKYANAGVVGVLKDPNGKHPIIQYDDDAKGLIGKNINILLYKDPKNPKYNRVLDRIAPVVQEGEHLSYTATDVDSIKSSGNKSLDAKLKAMPSPNGAVASEPFANQF